MVRIVLREGVKQPQKKSTIKEKIQNGINVANSVITAIEKSPASKSARTAKLLCELISIFSNR